MTFKQQRMIDKLKRYFDNEDEYNYKNVMFNAFGDSTFDKAIKKMACGSINGKTFKTGFEDDVRRFRTQYKYKPKGDDE